jgi:hypothetical protein
MRFQVPQFLEIEDKLFGPLTFKQFIYIAGSVGIAVVLFMLLPTFLAILLSTPVVVFGFALAFYKVNDKPFIEVVEAFIKFHTSGQLYLWQKEEKTPTAANRVAKPIEQVYVPKLSQSKLKDLSWSLDIKENSLPETVKDADPRFS